jgi:hypothetical protein
MKSPRDYDLHQLSALKDLSNSVIAQQSHTLDVKILTPLGLFLKSIIQLCFEHIHNTTEIKTPFNGGLDWFVYGVKCHFQQYNGGLDCVSVLYM